MLMKLVTAFNALSSQAWAFALVILGMATFWMACKCAQSDIRAALMTSGTGMIGGGIAMFQHSSGKPAETEPAPTSAPTAAPSTPAQPPAA